MKEKEKKGDNYCQRSGNEVFFSSSERLQSSRCCVIVQFLLY